MPFGFYFQNTGVFYDSGIFVKIYRDQQLINKTKFYHNVFRAVKRIYIYYYIEWMDDNE
jgi:hypothetical protein